MAHRANRVIPDFAASRKQASRVRAIPPSGTNQACVVLLFKGRYEPKVDVSLPIQNSEI